MQNSLLVTVVPLFYTILFPTTTKPLLITDDEAFRLLKKCSDENLPVALGTYFQDDKICRDECGYGKIQFSSEARNERQAFIYGLGKIKLNQALDSHKIIHENVIAEVQTYDDQYRQDLDYEFKTLSLLLSQWMAKYLPDAQQREFFLASLKDSKSIVAATASYLIRDADLQYEAFSMNSLSEQILFLYRLSLSKELMI